MSFTLLRRAAPRVSGVIARTQAYTSRHTLNEVSLTICHRSIVTRARLAAGIPFSHSCGLPLPARRPPKAGAQRLEGRRQECVEALHTCVRPHGLAHVRPYLPLRAFSSSEKDKPADNQSEATAGEASAYDDMGWDEFGAELEARAAEEEEKAKQQAEEGAEGEAAQSSDLMDEGKQQPSGQQEAEKNKKNKNTTHHQDEQGQQDDGQDDVPARPLTKKERKALERAKKREGKKNSLHQQAAADAASKRDTNEGIVLEVNEEGALRVFTPKSPLLAVQTSSTVGMLNGGEAAKASLTPPTLAAAASTANSTASTESPEAKRARESKAESLRQQIEKLRQNTHEKTWLEVQAGIAYAALFRDQKTPVPQILRQVFTPEITRRFGPQQPVRLIEPLWDELIGVVPAEIAVRIARSRELDLAYLEGQRAQKMPPDARAIQDDGVPVVYLISEEKLERMITEERSNRNSKEKEKKANTFAQKDIVFQVNIRPNDLLRKCLQATQFLLEGHPVKLQLKILGYEKLADITDLSKRGRISKNTTLTIQEQIAMAEAELEKERELGRESLVRAYENMLQMASYLELIRTRERDEESLRQRLIAEAKEKGLPPPVFESTPSTKRVKRHEGIEGLNKSTVQRTAELDEIKRMCEAQVKVPSMISNDVAVRNPLFVCIDKSQITKSESFVLYPSSRKHVKVATMGTGVGAMRNYTIRKLQIQLEELAE